MRMTRRTILVLTSVLLLALSPAVGKKPDRAPYVEGEILLKFTPRARGLDRAQMMASLNATRLQRFSSGVEHWRLGAGRTVAGAIAALDHNPLVAYVEPNFFLEEALNPNDPMLGDQWGLINTGQEGGKIDADIDAELAWEESTGSEALVVAVIDHGVDYLHSDLNDNLWENTAEANGTPGEDDDGNGYIDDIWGWDFVENNNTPLPYDDDPNSQGGCPNPAFIPKFFHHGTQVAGIIGAVGNNEVGIAGVAWTVNLMPLRIFPGAGTVSAATLAIQYAVENGADIINASWAVGAYSQCLYDAIDAAEDEGAIFVAAAMQTLSAPSNDNDQNPRYPASFDLENIIAVTATDRNDILLSIPGVHANYGQTSVDLAAPGGEILSTKNRVDEYCIGGTIQGPGQYGEGSGTSGAAPFVAGVAALMKDLDPSASIADVKCSMLTTTDPVPSLIFRTVAGGRLNAQRAIERLISGEPCEEPANFRFVTTIHGDPGYTRLNLVSLPYGNPYQGAEELCEALNLSSTATVTQYDGLGGKLTHECGKQQTEYELLPLKGVEVIERQPGIKQGIIEGWDLPDPSQIQIESLGPGDIGKNLFPVRFNGTAETPEDLCDQCGLSNQAMISRFDGETGQVESYVCGQLALWDLVLGEAVLIQEPNGPVTCTPCRYGSPCPEE